MNEPRIWTLKRFPPTMVSGRETSVRGAFLEDGEEVATIEADPVLDLLKRAAKSIATWREEAGGANLSDAVEQEIVALLGNGAQR